MNTRITLLAHKKEEAMKFSAITVMFLALMLPIPAHAGDLVIQTKSQHEQGLHQMYFGKSKFASIQNGRTDMYIDGRMCTMFLHEDQSKIMKECEAMWNEFRRMRDDMMKKHGMTEADLSKNMPKGSSKVRKIDSRVIAGYRQYEHLIVCLSKKVHELIVTTTSMNPQEWAKKFQLDDIPGQSLTDRALANLERNAFVMYRADILSAMGLNSFVFNSLPDDKKAELVKNARADMKQNGGPPPDMMVVSVEKKSMNVNLYPSYKKLTLKEFVGGMTGGASAGGDMSTPDMPAMTGGDLNLEELMQQQGVTDTQAMPTTKKKKQKDKKKKLTFKERMKLLKDKAKAKLKNAEE
jgi:hypothetical protein